MWIVNVILLLYLVDKSISCTCAPGHIQDGFCRSAVVIHGKATRQYYTDDVTAVSADKNKDKETNNPDTIEIVETVEMVTMPPWDREKFYDIEVIKVFKAPENSNIKPGDVIQAVTIANGAMCGRWLGLNEELLITGGLDNQKRLSFGLCSYKKTFSELTKLQLDGIQGAYDCDCGVIYFWYSNQENSCQMGAYRTGYTAKCLNDYGRCVKGKKEGCEWEITDDSCGTNPNSMPK